MLVDNVGTEYASISDEDLVIKAQAGDKFAEEFLIEKYKYLAKEKIKTYFIMGADAEDVVQEGMIGIFKAVRDYKENKEAAFKTFVQLCITRQIITAIKKANRMKHQPLNESLLFSSLQHEGNAEVDDLIGNDVDDPEKTLLFKELTTFVLDEKSHLFSELEIQVLRHKMEGKDYKEIAKELKKSSKAVDNAIQRSKFKLIKALQD